MAALVHQRLFARATAFVLTRIPVRDAVRSLLALAGHRPEPLRLAIDCVQHAGYRDSETRERAAALLELALQDLERLEATA